MRGRGEVEKAQKQFDQAVEGPSVHFESHYNLALIYLDANRVEEAIELLEKAGKLQPNHELVNIRLGMAYLRTERYQDAYRSFLLVLRLYPGNWFAPIGLALLHAAADDTEQAQRFLNDALELGGERARTAAHGYPILSGLFEKSR